MKKLLLTLGFLFLFLTTSLRAQNKSAAVPVNYDSYSFPENDTQNPCITPQEYATLNNEVSDNLKKLSTNKATNKKNLLHL